MEVIYRSFDGKMFSTPEECLTHEKEHPLFRMFNNSGELVTHPDTCTMLQLIDYKDGAAAFVELCKNCDSDHEGIYAENAGGWYWWTGDEYSWIDPEMLDILVRCGYFNK